MDQDSPFFSPAYSAVNDRDYNDSLMGAALVLFIGPGANKYSDARHGVFFPGIDVVASLKSPFSGLPCQQITLDTTPVSILDNGTDNLYF